MVTSVLQGLGRLSDGTPRQVKALREYEIARILARCDRLAAQRKSRAIATRDAALLAIGFAAALRRSEICGLQFGDLQFLDWPRDPGSMFVHIRRSKTDQFGRRPESSGAGRERDPAREPAAEVAGAFGHRRRTGIPDDAARGNPGRQGDASVRRRAAGEALRSRHRPRPRRLRGTFAGGPVSRPARRPHGARLDKIMEITRHTSPRVVLRYIRDAEAFDDHAGAGFL